MVGEVLVTDVTDAPALLASCEPACALITAANCGPFCKSTIFVAAGVAPEKKSTHAFETAAVVAASAVPVLLDDDPVGPDPDPDAPPHPASTETSRMKGTTRAHPTFRR